MKKPRHKNTIFCYGCGRQLFGFSNYIKLVNTVDGHTRKFHKVCGKQYLAKNPKLWEEVKS